MKRGRTPRPLGRRLVLALTTVAAAAAFALLPGSASATHFTGSTKTCAAQNPVTRTFDCVLNLSILLTNQGQQSVVIDIASTIGAEFATAPNRTGGTCAATTLTLVDADTVVLSPAPTGSGTCTIVLHETLTSDAFGEVCQLPDFLPRGINFPELRVCAQLVQPLPPTDKALCKNGVWEAFLIFKNQGDCVSFVSTGGKNEPGQNEPK
jgi:hypothetical protein